MCSIDKKGEKEGGSVMTYNLRSVVVAAYEKKTIF